MNLTGERISHIKFGEGIVVKTFKNQIEVAFGKELKLFQYPEGFEKFLKLKNVNIEKSVMKELESKRKKQAERRKKNLQHIQTMVKINRRRTTDSTHAVFHVEEDTWEAMQKEWNAFFGYYRTGKIIFLELLSGTSSHEQMGKCAGEIYYWKVHEEYSATDGEVQYWRNTGKDKRFLSVFYGNERLEMHYKGGDSSWSLKQRQHGMSEK